MSKLTILAILAGITASTVSAVDITFKRFSQPGCNYAENHIAKDTHLHDPYCKDFDGDEPAFYSFIVEPTDDQDDMYKNYCFITVYDQHNCEGQGFDYGNMTTYKNVCTGTPVPARSVRVSCQDAVVHTASYPPTTVTVPQTLTLDDPTATYVVADPTTFTYAVSTSTRDPASTTSKAEPKKDDKHSKDKKPDNIHENFSLSSTTFIAVSETTVYSISTSSTPTTPTTTITLVPAPRETDDVSDRPFLDAVCRDNETLEACTDRVLDAMCKDHEAHQECSNRLMDAICQVHPDHSACLERTS